jgi:hypothetical protein
MPVIIAGKVGVDAGSCHTGVPARNGWGKNGDVVSLRRNDFDCFDYVSKRHLRIALDKQVSEIPELEYVLQTLTALS